MLMINLVLLYIYAITINSLKKKINVTNFKAEPPTFLNHRRVVSESHAE